MAINRVDYAGETLLDVSSDSVTEDTLLDGETAHDSSGEKIVGRLMLPTFSKPNMVENPFFTINQRESSEYTNDGYTYDRWRLFRVSASNASVKAETLSDGSVKFSKIHTSYGGRFLQIFDDVKKFAGKTVTYSVLARNATSNFLFGIPETISGSLRTYISINASNTTSEYKLFSSTFTLPSDLSFMSLAFVITNANAMGSVDIKAVKLEFGTQSTLADDVAPDYATELLKCQRYFQRMSIIKNGLLGIFVGRSATTAYGMVNLATPMRTAPSTVTHGGSLVLKENDNATENSVTNIASYSMSGSNNALTFTSTNLGMGKYYIVRATNPTYIDLSADV